MKFIQKLEKSWEFWFLFSLSSLFTLLRFPSLFEPYWYGDEGVYEVIGHALREGRLLYQGVWDNKPPLLYVLYALVNGDQFGIKILSLIFGIGTIIALYFLAKKLLVRKSAVVVATIIFSILFGLPLLEGNIANAENFLVLPILIAANSILDKHLFSKKRTLFFTGFFLSLAFLFKIVAIFDTTAFILFLLTTEFSSGKDIKKHYKKFIPLAYGFFLPLIIVTGFFLIRGALSDYLSATFTENISYVNYSNKVLGIPQGFLILKTFLLALFLYYLSLRPKMLPKPILFLLLWISFSLYSVFFSQRPYSHYLLLLTPAFSLLIGAIIAEKRYRIPFTVLIISIVMVVVSSFTLYVKNISYYQNFLSFVTGHKNVTSYRAFFDKNTPRDYDVADYLLTREKPGDEIFIWGNSPQIYKLVERIPSGRYTVAYHITGYQDGLDNTAYALQKEKPRFIVILPNLPTYPFNLVGYTNRLTIEHATIYERTH